MKYIITESRLNDLVQKFISEFVGELDSRVYTTPGPTLSRYVGKNGRIIFEVIRTNKGLRLDVRNDLWELVRKMFSLSTKEVDKAFLEWMFNYNGSEYPAGVYNTESRFI